MENTLKAKILNATTTIVVAGLVAAGLAGVGAVTAPQSDANAVPATRLLPVATGIHAASTWP